MSRVDERLSFHSNAESLFCNRAVVLRFPYRDGLQFREMEPFVTASAVSSGWIWTIPLYNRISSGYVYSSDFISDDDAEKELRSHWGHERTKDAVPHKVRFETGKLRNLWVKNCIAIGLAGGFVEPLESTGLALTQHGVEMLASVLDARYYDDFIVNRYNIHLEKAHRDVIEFIVAHYCLTNREDTGFWRAVKNDTKIPASLGMRFDVFRHLLPSVDTKGLEELWFFRDYSWFAVLLGMNFDFQVMKVPESVMASALSVRSTKAKFIRQSDMPVHSEYLRKTVYETTPMNPGTGS